MSEELNQKRWWETRTAIITFLAALLGLVTVVVDKVRGNWWPPAPTGMEGTWVYKVETIGATIFPDGCSERVGTVRIENIQTTPFGSDVKLRGKRIWCVRGGGKSKERVSPFIYWNSDIASITSVL